MRLAAPLDVHVDVRIVRGDPLEQGVEGLRILADEQGQQVTRPGEQPVDDGRGDLVVSVRARDVAARISAGAREVAIEGRLRSGEVFRDADWVTIRG